MTLDYALKEGFIDLQSIEDRRFFYTINLAISQWKIVEHTDPEKGFKIGNILDTATGTTTKLDNKFVEKYAVKKENVVTDYWKYSVVQVPTAYDDPDLI
jgi:hypothetical protein